MKRFFDITISLFGLIVLSPILLIFMLLIFIQDWHNPFYFAPRVGKNDRLFFMIKLRSMVTDADKSGVDSTANTDNRITKIGRLVRSYKLDEITQLLNVLKGDMSLVGPRPNVKNETDEYTTVERNLLTIKPGITDFSSIVFSDEGNILANKKDPDLAYNQLIRPWKSRLGIIYIKNQSFCLDIQLIFYTVIAIVSKRTALNWVVEKLTSLSVDKTIISVCKRKTKLTPYHPPSVDSVIKL